MSLSNFLNPDDENIVVEEEVTLRDVIPAQTMPQLEEDEDKEEAGPPAMIDQALKGLMCLLSFKEQEQGASSWSSRD
ncbi:BgTH12-07285 [Blumeria graminis f. sp. triticale]|uniref:BgTH12-07285 n=1 Tax=Blumeria graminis f. sp. triticale TaxID=1689686 RepID=A0A9W4D990_BLUGR|nr:BgTH12-07285 [Blumeria graminis f. sp. triticale]